MIRTILTYPDPELKKKSQPVTVINDKIRELARDMAETMYAAPGVGLAAPQIGVRIAPGATTLTRIPRGDSSEAMTRAIARTPAFAAP